MYSIFHATFCVLNSILKTPAVSDWMYDVLFNSRCVKVNFVYSCSLTVDVNHSQCYSACVKLDLAHTYSLRLDAFLVPCHSRFFKLNVVRVWSSRMDIFPRTCLSRCVKLYFANISSVSPQVFPLSCHSSCVDLNFCAHVHFKTNCFSFHVILDGLNSVLHTSLV